MFFFRMFPGFPILFPNISLYFPNISLYFPNISLYSPNISLYFPNISLYFPNISQCLSHFFGWWLWTGACCRNQDSQAPWTGLGPGGEATPAGCGQEITLGGEESTRNQGRGLEFMDVILCIPNLIWSNMYIYIYDICIIYMYTIYIYYICILCIIYIYMYIIYV